MMMGSSSFQTRISEPEPEPEEEEEEEEEVLLQLA
jgi:hypothetical protein